MDPKGVRSTVAVTAEEVKSALSRSRTLSSEEEKVVRMRHGAGASNPRAPLPRAAEGNEELQDELLLLEVQLLKAYRHLQAQAKAKPAPSVQVSKAPVDPARAQAKSKIVRALRKKK